MGKFWKSAKHFFLNIQVDVQIVGSLNIDDQLLTIQYWQSGSWRFTIDSQLLIVHTYLTIKCQLSIIDGFGPSTVISPNPDSLSLLVNIRQSTVDHQLLVIESIFDEFGLSRVISPNPDGLPLLVKFWQPTADHQLLVIKSIVDGF